MCVGCFLARLFSPRTYRIVASTPAVAEKNISRVNLAYILARPCVSGLVRAKNGSLWIRRRPRSVRVSAVEMERMRSLRSRSVKLLPSCRNSCCLRGTVARTRVYAFSSVVPRKKLRIERAREKEEEKKWKGEHRGGTRLSSPEFDRFSSRSQDVFRSPTGFLCPLKWGISFPLKKGGTFFRPWSLVRATLCIKCELPQYMDFRRVRRIHVKRLRIYLRPLKNSRVPSFDTLQTTIRFFNEETYIPLQPYRPNRSSIAISKYIHTCT